MDDRQRRRPQQPGALDRGLRHHLPGPALPASEGCEHGAMEAWNRAGCKLMPPSFRGVRRRARNPSAAGPVVNGFRARACATPRNDGGEAVNSGEKPNSLRISRRRPYIHGRLANVLESGPATQGPNSPMRFTPQFLEELRARLPVSEVVGRRVKLKKAGREWKGLSPFQQEKSPSFTVNDQKGFYHDFSSGKHGDIISISDGDRGRRLYRGRRAPRLDGRHGAAGGDARCRQARAAPQDAAMT